jgi:hypothetical protein
MDYNMLIKNTNRTILYLPPGSWRPEYNKLSGDINFKGFTHGVILINNYYYPVTFYNREQIIKEIDEQFYYMSENGIFVIKELNIETIIRVSTDAINSVAFKNNLPHINYDISNYHEFPLIEPD